MIDTSKSKKLDHYWVLEEDPRDLVQQLQRRSYESIEAFKRLNLYQRVMRSWQYYHNNYWGSNDGAGPGELKSLGEDGEKVGASFNHYRSLIQSILTIVTGHRPALNCLAVNTEIESLHQADIGDDLIAYYLAQGDEAVLRRAAEQAAVLSQGFTVCEWEDDKGPVVVGDPETGELIFQGDIDTWNPSIFDVTYNFNQSDFSRNPWVMVRKWVNKWDLIEQYSDRKTRDAILDSETYEQSQWQWNITKTYNEISDEVPVHIFWHKPTPSVPDGMEFKFVEDTPLGEPEPLRYKSIPVKRMMPAEVLLTSYGYASGFDLQGPAEALNNELSSILTNHKQFAINRIWVDSASSVDYSMISEDLALVQCDRKPEPLQLAHSASELYKMAEVLTKEMEVISGVNSVFRGEPQASLRSGTALALVDAKAVQHQSLFSGAYHTHLEEYGQLLIENLQVFPNQEIDRVFSIAGRHKTHQIENFRPADIDKINRVYVQTGNALMRTLSGRLELATLLLQYGLVSDPQQLVTVLDTGQVEPLTEAAQAQRSLIREENTALLKGESTDAMMTDDHVLHIREHAAVANSPVIRRDQEIMANLNAHILEHIEQMMDQETQQLQVMLGFQAPQQPGPVQPQQPQQQAPPAKDSNTPGLPGPEDVAADPNAIGPSLPPNMVEVG